MLFAHESFDSFIVDPTWGPRFWGTLYAVKYIDLLLNFTLLLVWSIIPSLNP